METLEPILSRKFCEEMVMKLDCRGAGFDDAQSHLFPSPKGKTYPESYMEGYEEGRKNISLSYSDFR